MILVLNAPAGAGKDTIANRIIEVSPVFKKAEMKKPMWDIAKSVLGDDVFNLFCELYNNRDTKEVPHTLLGGLSPRKLFIHISEVWCKPLFGKDYFGQRMLQTVLANKPYETILSDGGFNEELVPALYAGETVMIVRLFRDGYSFDGDSRSYLNIQHDNAWYMDLRIEEGKVDEAVNSILSGYESLLEVK
ncbi:hypothetical protein Pm5460_26 [Proteus phage vB_PmiP_Pm5460]|uniref:Uncharacterized protein n=1 Tax=Proteus phage vB_PmiP_Pm5460 TaxID=1636249 RepID=A0A0G2SSE5_9CAUD|nr:deoxynucleoside monophosphate kinase [Proteus phage vB_PmiP_Pm5460]AKA61836.1 hypothetical protein Pm5460_26 [Proteus phage vB_PmiP_Pm5460]